MNSHLVKTSGRDSAHIARVPDIRELKEGKRTVVTRACVEAKHRGCSSMTHSGKGLATGRTTYGES